MTDNGFLDGIHDEPGIVSDAFDFDIGFIGSQIVCRLVIVAIYIRRYNNRSCMNILCNHGVGNTDAVDIKEGTGGHSGRKAQVDDIGEAKA